jgi:hypothetical protein
VLAANMQYPPYVHDTTTLPWPKRLPLLADIITSSGTTIVSAQEIGGSQCIDLLAELGPRWSYRKTLNGINAVFWRDEWSGDTVLDYNLPSYGQSQRTLLVVGLASNTRQANPSSTRQTPVKQTLLVGSTHFAAAASDLTRAQANVAKLAQVKKVCELLAGYPQIIVGADLARADDTDDVAYLKAQGWALNGRTTATPQVVLSKGIDVGKSRLVDTGKACDHDAVLTPFTLHDSTT